MKFTYNTFFLITVLFISVCFILSPLISFNQNDSTRNFFYINLN